MSFNPLYCFGPEKGREWDTESFLYSLSGESHGAQKCDASLN